MHQGNLAAQQMEYLGSIDAFRQEPDWIEICSDSEEEGTDVDDVED